MASTVRGTAILKWGTYTLTGYIVQDTDLGLGGDTFKIVDEDGQNISLVEGFNLTDDQEITVIPKSTTTRPAIGASITFNSVVYTLKNLKVKNNNKAPEMWTLSLTRLPGVTFT